MEFTIMVVRLKEEDKIKYEEEKKALIEHIQLQQQVLLVATSLSKCVEV